MHNIPKEMITFAGSLMIATNIQFTHVFQKTHHYCHTVSFV